MTAGEPFEIPVRPTRHFPRAGGLEYEGDTTFVLEPEPARDEAACRDLVERVLDGGAYRHGDFLELPLPLWLVRDEDTGDTFRVSVRDGTVRLHVLPSTDPPGLRRFHERLQTASEATWHVTCETTAP